LELGKDNASYMRSVLASTSNKDYQQLAQAFVLTCLQRYGVRREAEICKDDRLAERSQAIADQIHDELDALDAQGEGKSQVAGPLTILRSEREVLGMVAKVAWLFEPYLQDLYERRQWKEIAHFESSCPGAKLVAAIVLATARTGELAGQGESVDLEKFHAEHRKWLGEFLLGHKCDAECRGKLLDLMLSVYGESDGDYDETMRRLLLLPRAESGAALAKLHVRLLWCQVDADDLALFRDHVLVPAVTEALARPKLDAMLVEDLVGLVAMTSDPENGDALAAWRSMLAAIQKAGEHFEHAFVKRRAAVKRERANPPPMVKKISFCAAAEAEERSDTRP
jgi:hypothetical protein